MKTRQEVTQIGVDTHRKFSKATARDAAGRVVWRQRLDHVDPMGPGGGFVTRTTYRRLAPDAARIRQIMDDSNMMVDVYRSYSTPPTTVWIAGQTFRSDAFGAGLKK